MQLNTITNLFRIEIEHNKQQIQLLIYENMQGKKINDSIERVSKRIINIIYEYKYKTLFYSRDHFLS
jgi:hypothetical protein